VRRGKIPEPGELYLRHAPGVFVSQSVKTVFDFPLRRGFYTVSSLGREYDIEGESLDLAMVMASLGKDGVFSADVNHDGTLSPVLGQSEKESALARHGMSPSYANFW
jgi:hypothetical protein